MNVARLSAIRAGRLYPSGNIPGTHFCYRLSQPQGHSAAGRIMSIKISNESNGNRTHYLPVCSALPQPTEHRVPTVFITFMKFLYQIFLTVVISINELALRSVQYKVTCGNERLSRKACTLKHFNFVLQCITV